MTASGIRWYAQAYHKRPSAPATAFDIAVGVCVALWLALRHRASIVHVRSYVPATIGLIVSRLTGAKLLFDIRGFWADERVDGGIWPRGSFLHRTAKWVERWLFATADQVVTLTEASKREIAAFPYLRGRCPPVTVIPTCVDLSKFKAPPDRSLNPLVFGYVGSVGTWYRLEEMLQFFKLLRRTRRDAKLLIVNRGEHEMIRAALRQADIELSQVELVAAEHHEVPAQIARMHVGAAFLKPSYSKIATSPTKLGEYLACGVPCLGDGNAGDMKEIVEDHNVGVIVSDFSDAGRSKAIDKLLSLVADPQTPTRCVATAAEFFSLDTGVSRYRAIYRTLVGQTADVTTVACSRVET